MASLPGTLRRLTPRRLHARLTLLGGAMLAVVIGAHTGYTVVRQTHIETKALDNRAQALADQISIATASLLVSRRYSEIEELLLGSANFPDARRIQVADANGRVYADVVHHDANQAPRAVFEFNPLPIPAAKEAFTESHDDKLIVWQPIRAGDVIGWVRLVYSRAGIAEMRERLILDGLGAALLAVIASALLFALFLRRPMRSLARATAFAERLHEMRGTSFGVDLGAFEIEQLGDALNMTSLRLAAQERALVASERRLQAILQNAMDGILVTDARGQIENANPAAEHMFRFAPGELAGQPFNDLVPDFLLLHDSDQDVDPPQTDDGMGVELETTGIRRDGSAFPLLAGMRQVDLEGRRFYVGVLRDMTQQKHLDKMKENFVEAVSHELRTPLTSLHASLELLTSDLAAGTQAQDDVKNLAAMAYKNSERLVRLVNDILDFKDIEAGRALFDVSVVNIVPLLREAVAAQKPLAEERNVRLQLTVEMPSARSLVDPKWLVQAFGALIAQGIRTSPTAEIVHISLSKLDDKLRIAITDHGPGIPESARPYLFRKFVKLEALDPNYQSGADVGIGLAKTIVEHLGGALDFTSIPNEVTTFVIDLPEVEPLRD